MNDEPKRVLEHGSDASATERDLLRSAADVEPPAGARGATWTALAARLPPAGGGAPPPPTGPAGVGGGAAKGSAIASKAIAAGLVGAAIAVGSLLLVRSRDPERSTRQAPAETTGAVPATPPAAHAGASAEAQSVASEPASPKTARERVTGSASAPPLRHGRDVRSSTTNDGVPRSHAPAPTPADALREEIALVAAARAALRRGDGPAALASLETAQKHHPDGALLQEREVLTIEALAQSGDTQGASRRATAFLRAFPASPHASHVRSFER